MPERKKSQTMKDIHGGDIWKASKESSRRPGEIMDFSASINPLGLPPASKRAVRKSVRLIPPYPDPASASLVSALSGYHGVAPAQLLPANGSTQLIHMVPEVLRPGRALVIEPAFSEYRSALKRHGWRVDSLVLKEAGGFPLDVKRLAKRLKAGYDVVYLANPANPTGALTKKEDVLEAARACASFGAVLVADEAFADFVPGESITTEAPALENVIVLRSMTKFFAMAGLRLGCMISNERTIRRFSAAMPPWSVNTLASIAAEAAIRDKAYARATARWLRSESAFLYDGLKAIPGLSPLPSKANFFLVKLTGSSITAPELKAALLKEGILIRDLSAFRGLGPGYFRVCVRKRRDNRVLLETLRRVQRD